MKVSYKGDGHHAVTEAYGYTFPQGQWVDVDGRASEKLPHNPMFDAEEAEPEPEGPSVEELRARLDELGVMYHPRAGATKLAELLAVQAGDPPAEG